MNKITECLRKPDQYKIPHILLHAAAVIFPFLLGYWSPIATGVSLTFWAAFMLVIGGHGAKALGGDLGAFGVSLGFGAVAGLFAWLVPVEMGAAVLLGVLVFALAWLTEYHQNGGDWCGQDVPNFHNRATGAGIGLVVAFAIAVAQEAGVFA